MQPNSKICTQLYQQQHLTPTHTGWCKPQCALYWHGDHVPDCNTPVMAPLCHAAAHRCCAAQRARTGAAACFHGVNVSLAPLCEQIDAPWKVTALAPTPHRRLVKRSRHKISGAFQTFLACAQPTLHAVWGLWAWHSCWCVCIPDHPVLSVLSCIDLTTYNNK